MPLKNPTALFTEIKRVTRTLDQGQVDVINAILNTAAGANWPIGWVAYGLATAWHEAHFTPQDEWGKGKGRKYGVPGKHGGQVPYGRGLVQLTWDSNYEWADGICGLNGALLKDFSIANRTDVATKILVVGMQTGHFTGVGLGRFLGSAPGSIDAFTNCRKIINGQDKAVLIAGYADHFQDGLKAAGF